MKRTSRKDLCTTKTLDQQESFELFVDLHYFSAHAFREIVDKLCYHFCQFRFGVSVPKDAGARTDLIRVSRQCACAFFEGLVLADFRAEVSACAFGLLDQGRTLRGQSSLSLNS